MFMLELKKLKRTFAAEMMILFGIFGDLLIILNFTLRHKTLLSNNASPMKNLILQNWGIISTLNIMALIAGACILYNIEYSDNAMLKISALPIRMDNLFLAKTFVMILNYIIIIILESAAFAYCGMKYLPKNTFVLKELILFMMYAFLLSLPVLVFMLFVSSLCKNMWISAGIGMIGVMSTVIAAGLEKSVLNLLPFSIINQPVFYHAIKPDLKLSLFASGETFLFLIVQMIVSKIRRENA